MAVKLEISTNNNNITVEFKSSKTELEMITTDARELQEIIARTLEKQESEKSQT